MLKNPLFALRRASFDKLRTNGGGFEIIEVSPFMLNLSKHAQEFFRRLLSSLKAERTTG